MLPTTLADTYMKYLFVYMRAVRIPLELSGTYSALACKANGVFGNDDITRWDADPPLSRDDSQQPPES